MTKRELKVQVAKYERAINTYALLLNTYSDTSSVNTEIKELINRKVQLEIENKRNEKIIVDVEKRNNLMWKDTLKYREENNKLIDLIKELPTYNEEVTLEENLTTISLFYNAYEAAVEIIEFQASKLIKQKRKINKFKKKLKNGKRRNSSIPL